jgi:hypothetical protein
MQHRFRGGGACGQRADNTVYNSDCWYSGRRESARRMYSVRGGQQGEEGNDGDGGR